MAEVLRSRRGELVLAAGFAVAVLVLALWPAGPGSQHAHAGARLVTLHLPPTASPTASQGHHATALSQANPATFLAAYASAPSVSRGESIDFAVSTSSRSYAVDVQRFSGASGYVQEMLVRGGLAGKDQGHWIRGTFGVRHCPTCMVSARTGEVDPNWSWTYTLRVPAAWPSGLYRAVFRSRTDQDAVPFVVRADGDRAPVLVVLSWNTYEAYNDWGGKSLYAYNSYGTPTLARSAEAVSVTFWRPFATWSPTAAPVIGYGTASDWRLAAWLDQHHLQADYVTDVDVAASPGVLSGHRLVVFAGHSEYWSQAEYQAAVDARDAGESLAFLGGNDVYWRVRYEQSYRVLVEYRTPRLDPMYGNNTEVTGLFDSTDIGEPQSRLTGTLYESGVARPGLPWTVTSSAPAWLLQGSGLAPGGSVQHAVAGECDRYYPDAPQPKGVVVIAQTTFLGGRAVCSSILYQAASGAWVFSAGDMNWDLHLLDGSPLGVVSWNLIRKLV